MRIKMTFDLDEQQLKALGFKLRHKRPMNRTQAVQFISSAVYREIGAAAEHFTQALMNAMDQEAREREERAQLKLFEGASESWAAGQIA